MKFRFTVLAALLLLAPAVRAQTTAFTYQGQLNGSNGPVTGPYDFRFKIFDGNSNVVAGPLTNALVGVTNGLFTTLLNFNTNVFDGSLRSLEIGVRTNGDTNAYIVLSPRQTLTSVPYAVQALNSVTASNLAAPLSATNLTGTIPNSLLSTNVAVLTNNNVVFSGNVTAASFTGSGSGLTSVPGTSLVGVITGNGSGLVNLPAASLTGTIADARLSTNVALYNTNAIFSNNVTAASFTGSGRGLTNVPGAFFWITNVATSLPILPNQGFIATNDIATVILTLPASPTNGDVYKVAGLGAGGWMIAQNANQQILTGNLADSIGASWIPRESPRAWSAVASSADGTKLVATVKGGNIYTSVNSGASWAPQDSGRSWSSVASSSDGTKLVAGVGDNGGLTGLLYTSANSGVGAWTSHDNTRQWVSVASSSDGSRLAAAVYGLASFGNPGAYISANSGTGWARTAVTNQFCSAVASSTDGTNLVATIFGGLIWTSKNAGVSWTARAGNLNWTAVASSADGSRLLAAASSSPLFISYDSGTNWTSVNTTVSEAWTAVASSASGSRLLAAASGGNVYISTDSGVTWAQLHGVPAAAWTGAACSADGSKLVLVANGGQIYTSSQGSTTIGTAGYLLGPQHSAIELICISSNLFMPLSHEGNIRAY